MKLRNFLYLNTKVLEDYVAAIDGYIYDEESQEIATSSENTLGGKGTISVISGNGSHTGKRSEEIKRSVHISDAAKFEKVYKYLRSDDEGLKYFEFLTDADYSGLYRDDFLEVLVTARFSKMKELTDSVKNEAIQGFSALGQMKSGKEIACVFEFEDGLHPLVAYLDESYFRCGQENFVGQAYLLCKIIRKVPKGQSIKLDEIFDDIKKLPLNRSQRRNMPKNMDNPAELRDVIKGPALVVLPIAVYQ